MREATIPVAKSVSEYISRFPPATRKKMNSIRELIKKTAPKATELISYQIPGYNYKGMLVYFAGWKDHISVYPVPRGEAVFAKELAQYKGGKGTLQLPLDKSIPFDLIRRIIQYRLKENETKAALKTKAKPRFLKKKTGKLTEKEQVKEWLAKQSPTDRATINMIRKIIIGANNKLAERIKWNAPSYYYKEDILTFGPVKKEQLLLVFHHPSIVQVKSGLLEGNFKDRRLVVLKNKTVTEKNKQELMRIINEVMNRIDLKK